MAISSLPLNKRSTGIWVIAALVVVGLWACFRGDGSLPLALCDASRDYVLDISERKLAALAADDERGNPEAAYLLGLHSWYANENHGAAIDFMRRSADDEYVAAQFTLGRMILETDQEGAPNEAAIYISAAADQGLPEAMLDLGWLYESGNGVRMDFEQAAYWYRSAGISGLEDAREQMIDLIARWGRLDVDDADLVGWIKPGASRGHAASQYLQYALTIQKDGKSKSGHTWLEKAAGQTFGPACMELAGILLEEEPESRRAGTLVSAAAEADWPAAQIYLTESVATNAENEDAVQKSADYLLRAEEKLQQLVPSGHPDICYMLAHTLRLVAPDELADIQFYFQRAALRGHTAAQFELGRILLASERPHDSELAFHYLQVAAEAGMPDAQFEFGVMLRDGVDGQMASPTDAVRWLSRAAEAGHPGAIAALEICIREGIGCVKNEAIADQLLEIMAETEEFGDEESAVEKD